jgi:hypothetical protein
MNSSAFHLAAYTFHALFDTVGRKSRFNYIQSGCGKIYGFNHFLRRFILFFETNFETRDYVNPAMDPY